MHGQLRQEKVLHDDKYLLKDNRMTLESPNLRRKRLERQKAYVKEQAEKPPEKIKISTVLRVVSMIVFANIFSGK